MNNNEIMNQAMQIVRRHLDYIDEYNINTVNISKSELVCISMALAISMSTNDNNYETNYG